MIHILNKYISPKKTIIAALTTIYGIGVKRALGACGAIGISFKDRSHKLTPSLIAELNRHILNKFVIGSSLKRHIHGNIQSLIKIRSYRGIRHQNKLPARGQRTHTNAQTRKR